MSRYSWIVKAVPLARRLRDLLQAHTSMLKRHTADIADIRTDTHRRYKHIEELVEENRGHYVFFDGRCRHLSNDDLVEMGRLWLRRFGYVPGDPVGKKMLAYMAHRICMVENSCVGRVAGALDAILLRVLTVRSVRGTTVDVLEIGTLFGVGAAVIYDCCLGCFSSVHITVIDPLDGFYNQLLDSNTAIPVNERIFRHNMAKTGVPDSDYTIIKRLSTAPEAIQEAARKEYDVIIIDGDHSHFGVKSDYDNYHKMVKPGGYILFDDYSPNFPGIMQFIDENMSTFQGLDLLGVGADTAIFRAAHNKVAGGVTGSDA